MTGFFARYLPAKGNGKDTRIFTRDVIPRHVRVVMGDPSTRTRTTEQFLNVHPLTLVTRGVDALAWDMGAAKVLVVDDEPGMVRLITLYLQQAGYTVISATTGSGGLEAIERQEPDLVVLDIGLPDIDGFAVCRHMRKTRDTPVIMLTARGEPKDRIAGLEGGADDYMPKPFQPDELVARVRAVLRRARPAGQRPQRYVVNGLTVDVLQRQVNLEGHRIELRPKEFDLLVELISHPGQVFTREQLVERVWGYEYLGDGATLDVHVWRLRSKLGETGKQAQYIHTVWGVGYCLKAASSGA
ncbi:MAG: hypothetical protein NVSMB52_12930 [Chloroflexota bacterium]